MAAILKCAIFYKSAHFIVQQFHALHMPTSVGWKFVVTHYNFSSMITREAVKQGSISVTLYA